MKIEIITNLLKQFKIRKRLRKPVNKLAAIVNEMIMDGDLNSFANHTDKIFTFRNYMIYRLYKLRLHVWKFRTKGKMFADFRRYNDGQYT